MGRVNSLLVQLKRRHVYRVAVVYAAVGWLLVQVVTQVFPVFSFPAWMEQLAVLAVLAGFPVALVLAWLYELKPDGIHRDGPAPGRPGRRRSHRIDVLIALLVMVSLVATAAVWMRQKPVKGTPEIAALAAPAAASAPTSDRAQAPPQSVAVLPFDNMSGDARQKYFSEGVTSDIIGLLARNPALHVAARTSSFFFEGKSQDIRLIAQKLNVRSVLEGSIQTDDNRVHIEASLVNATDGYQLWSQSYDRSLNDILGVQADIAQSIARALAPTLTGAPVHPAPAPAQIDPDAYRNYLQAQFYFDQRLNEGQTPASRDALNRAVELFRQVVAAAPDFADGQAAYARALSTLNRNGALDDQINAAFRHALAIDPENPQALNMAILYAAVNQDWDGVIANALILRRTAAHTAVGAEGLSRAYFVFGLWDQGAVTARAWARIDPFSYPAWAAVTNNYFAEAHYQDAIDAAGEALTLHPDDPVSREYQCVSLASLGRIEQAKAVLEALSRPGIPEPLRVHCQFFITLHGDSEKAAMAFVHRVLAHDPGDAGPPGDVGFMLSHTAAVDQAMDWYQKAFATDQWVFGFYPGKTAPASFLQSPRWLAFTRQPDYQRWLAARQRAQSALGAAVP